MTTGSARPDPVREFLLDRIAAGAMPGATWWVEGPKGVISRGAVGDATIEPVLEPALEDTPYDLASLTKPLATALLAVLIEGEGKIDTGAPAVDLLPELRGSAYETVTLASLAAHRAGLPAWRPLYLDASTAEGYVRAIARTVPADAPGTTRYSDLSYLLLGAAVERAAGERLDRLFDRRVAGPLGLLSTGFAGSGGRFTHAAATENGSRLERGMAGASGEGHEWRTAIPRGEVHDGNAHGLRGVAGHAGLFGTAAEVAAIGREILAPDSLALSAAARLRLLVPVAGPGTRTFGFTTAALSGAARDVLPEGSPGHTGFTGTSVWLDPGAGRVYVLLTNRIHPAVPDGDFQPVRREFHRIAAALA
ncbi:MAG: beta-lactamase family protein [Acidobacteriia bacterium]|nr:beta-lactamase family protein [Terriglobia bacterium]